MVQVEIVWHCHSIACFLVRFWCLKESYVKAIGVGLNLDLQTISFQVKGASLVPIYSKCDSCSSTVMS